MTADAPSPDITSNDSIPDDQLITIPKTSAACQPSNNMKSNGYPENHEVPLPESEVVDKNTKSGIDARSKISSLLKGREQEWTAVAKKEGPLRLLDLPMDVLKEIVKEVRLGKLYIQLSTNFKQVTHTNDLTALALTHSALHNLAIPHIYSRFDIVWPDAHATNDPRTGVDALTYGLATLCMGDVLTQQNPNKSFTCLHCGTVNSPDCTHIPISAPGNGQRRLGNQYPQFTRKFSLGNGPADWVQEYLITKESGKMLGTLVALAVARMVNLEAFVWDMPTGVLRDVWLALASLETRNPNKECRLERVWVRWHDNSDAANPSAPPAPSNTGQQMFSGSTMTSVGWTVPLGSANPSPLRALAQSHVEYPTLSVLPPLKSLSVLDIDELDYLDEMSILIAKSKNRLRELRVGISAKAVSREFAIAWDGQDLQQVDHKAQWPGASTIGERRLGGVLGVLLGRIFDIRKKPRAARSEKKDPIAVASSTPMPMEAQHIETQVPFPIDMQNGESLSDQHLHTPEASLEEDWAGKDNASATEGTLNTDAHHITDPAFTNMHLDPAQSDMESLNALISAHGLHSTPNEEALADLQPITGADPTLRRVHTQSQKQSKFSEIKSAERERLDGRLRLQTLELERIPLSVSVLQKGFDWSVLTNLTILDCAQHDRLWVMLRRHFQPTPIGPGHSSRHSSSAAMQYHLNLKKIHTDAVSPSLISFLKETLAPNTLETLFLQDRKRSSGTPVCIVRYISSNVVG